MATVGFKGLRALEYIGNTLPERVHGKYHMLQLYSTI